MPPRRASRSGGTSATGAGGSSAASPSSASPAASSGSRASSSTRPARGRGRGAAGRASGGSRARGGGAAGGGRRGGAAASASSAARLSSPASRPAAAAASASGSGHGHGGGVTQVVAQISLPGGMPQPEQLRDIMASLLEQTTRSLQQRRGSTDPSLPSPPLPMFHTPFPFPNFFPPFPGSNATSNAMNGGAASATGPSISRSDIPAAMRAALEEISAAAGSGALTSRRAARNLERRSSSSRGRDIDFADESSAEPAAFECSCGQCHLRDEDDDTDPSDEDYSEDEYGSYDHDHEHHDHDYDDEDGFDPDEFARADSSGYVAHEQPRTLVDAVVDLYRMNDATMQGRVPNESLLRAHLQRMLSADAVGTADRPIALDESEGLVPVASKRSKPRAASAASSSASADAMPSFALRPSAPAAVDFILVPSAGSAAYGSQAATPRRGRRGSSARGRGKRKRTADDEESTQQADACPGPVSFAAAAAPRDSMEDCASSAQGHSYTEANANDALRYPLVVVFGDAHCHVNTRGQLRMPLSSLRPSALSVAECTRHLGHRANTTLLELGCCDDVLRAGDEPGALRTLQFKARTMPQETSFQQDVRMRIENMPRIGPWYGAEDLARLDRSMRLERERLRRPLDQAPGIPLSASDEADLLAYLYIARLLAESGDWTLVWYGLRYLAVKREERSAASRPKVERMFDVLRKAGLVCDARRPVTEQMGIDAEGISPMVRIVMRVLEHEDTLPTGRLAPMQPGAGERASHALGGVNRESCGEHERMIRDARQWEERKEAVQDRGEPVKQTAVEQNASEEVKEQKESDESLAMSDEAPVWDPFWPHPGGDMPPLDFRSAPLADDARPAKRARSTQTKQRTAVEKIKTHAVTRDDVQRALLKLVDFLCQDPVMLVQLLSQMCLFLLRVAEAAIDEASKRPPDTSPTYLWWMSSTFREAFALLMGRFDVQQALQRASAKQTTDVPAKTLTFTETNRVQLQHLFQRMLTLPPKFMDRPYLKMMCRMLCWVATPAVHSPIHRAERLLPRETPEEARRAAASFKPLRTALFDMHDDKARDCTQVQRTMQSFDAILFGSIADLITDFQEPMPSCECRLFPLGLEDDQALAQHEVRLVARRLIFLLLAIEKCELSNESVEGLQTTLYCLIQEHGAWMLPFVYATLTAEMDCLLHLHVAPYAAYLEKQLQPDSTEPIRFANWSAECKGPHRHAFQTAPLPPILDRLRRATALAQTMFPGVSHSFAVSDAQFWQRDREAIWERLGAFRPATFHGDIVSHRQLAARLGSARCASSLSRLSSIFGGTGWTAGLPRPYPIGPAWQKTDTNLLPFLTHWAYAYHRIELLKRATPSMTDSSSSVAPIVASAPETCRAALSLLFPDMADLVPTNVRVSVPPATASASSAAAVRTPSAASALAASFPVSQSTSTRTPFDMFSFPCEAFAYRANRVFPYTSACLEYAPNEECDAAFESWPVQSPIIRSIRHLFTCCSRLLRAVQQLVEHELRFFNAGMFTVGATRLQALDSTSAPLTADVFNLLSSLWLLTELATVREPFFAGAAAAVAAFRKLVDEHARLLNYTAGSNSSVGVSCQWMYDPRCTVRKKRAQLHPMSPPGLQRSVSDVARQHQCTNQHALIYPVREERVVRHLPTLGPVNSSRKLVVSVRREHVLSDAFDGLRGLSASAIHSSGVSLQFANEPAIGPGVFRECLALVLRRVFDPQYALFVPLQHQPSYFLPSSSSAINPAHLSYFHFTGRLFAMAILSRTKLEYSLAPACWQYILGRKIDWRVHFAPFDPQMYDSFQKLLAAHDIDAFDLTFSTDVASLMSTEERDLIPGGRHVRVTHENKHKYVQLKAEMAMFGAVKEQLQAFKRGFEELVPLNKLALLSDSELPLFICGVPTISVSDWQKHTQYRGFSSSSPVVTWFWQLLHDFNDVERRNLLFFATSLSRLPANGFAGVQRQDVRGFTLSRMHVSQPSLVDQTFPTAHTCFHELSLPEYSSKEILRSKLLAVCSEREQAEGFGML